MITKVRGTQDFLDLTLFNIIIDTMKTHLMRSNFTEIATPIIEPLELFKRSLGTETEVVTKQMFIIEQGEHDAEPICLRPEATASTMRAFLESGAQHTHPTPYKIFSWGPMFRHERPQKGRYRQFNQFNIEIIGTESIYHDINLIALLDHIFMRTFALNNYALLINFLGCAADRKAYQKILHDFLEQGIGILCAHCLVRKEKNILRTLDCKEEKCQTYYRTAPRITEHLCNGCTVQWNQLQEGLSLLSISYSHQPSLVRGLDYYEKTVFEFVSTNLGAQSTFCGGGRYAQLATQLGATHDYPSLGAALGIERFMLLLESNNYQVPTQPLPVHALMPLSPEQYDLALIIADELQIQGLCVELMIEGDSIKQMFRRANKIGARTAIIIGSEEQAGGFVTVKQMITGTEERVKQVELVTYLKSV